MTATTLHEAATRGDALATKTLLDANPDQVNAADGDHTALLEVLDKRDQ